MTSIAQWYYVHTKEEFIRAHMAYKVEPTIYDPALLTQAGFKEPVAMLTVVDEAREIARDTLLMQRKLLDELELVNQNLDEIDKSICRN